MQPLHPNHRAKLLEKNPGIESALDEYDCLLSERSATEGGTLSPEKTTRLAELSALIYPRHPSKEKPAKNEKKREEEVVDIGPHYALISRPYDPNSVSKNYPKEGDPNHCTLCRHRASHGPEDGCMDCGYTRDGGHIYCERHE